MFIFFLIKRSYIAFEITDLVRAIPETNLIFCVTGIWMFWLCKRIRQNHEIKYPGQEIIFLKP